jgi:prepilin-type N-terminal cleavage/methylation domain-containing protein
MKRRGFTLLEVVVATALLGVGVGIAMQVFSGGLGNMRRIDLAHRAMNHAENVMNEILSDQSITGPIQLSGDLDEDFSYTASVQYWNPPEDQGLKLDITQKPMELLSVVVDIQFKHDRFGKHYRAVCLKAVSLQPEQGGLVPSGNPLQRLFGGRHP